MPTDPPTGRIPTPAGADAPADPAATAGPALIGQRPAHVVHGDVGPADGSPTDDGPDDVIPDEVSRAVFGGDELRTAQGAGVPPVSPVAPPNRGSLPGPVVTLIGLAAGMFVLAAMRSSQDIVAPTVLALVIAMAVSPMQAVLARNLPGVLAMLITVVVTFVGLLGFVAALGWALFAFGNEIGQYQDDLNQLIADISSRLSDLGVDDQQITSVLDGIDLGAAASVALNVAEGLYGVVTVLALALTLLFFILLDGGSFSARFAAIKRIRPTVAASLSDFALGVRRYLIVTTVFGAIVAVADVILLTALDVPLPLVWGVLAFLTGYIPTIGLVIGLVPPVLLALLENGWVNALIVLVGYLLINNVIQSVIQPKFIGDAVGLNIATSFFSLVLWGFVLGPLGALLAIPMSLMARAVLSDSEARHRWLGIIVGDKAPPEDEIAAMVGQVSAPQR